jgi:hypothetical protein
MQDVRWLVEQQLATGAAAPAELDDAGRTDTAIDVDDACEILDSLSNLTEALAAADPALRRRVFDAFRLALTIDRNAGQIRAKALISSAFTKTRDLQHRSLMP